MADPAARFVMEESAEAAGDIVGSSRNDYRSRCGRAVGGNTCVRWEGEVAAVVLVGEAGVGMVYSN